MIYIFSISFQVAGALLLMINSMSTKRDKVILRFAGHGIIYRDNDTNSLDYKKGAFIDIYKEAWLSKFAFLWIAIGYFGGVFGEMGNDSKIILTIFIAVSTMVIIAASYFVVGLIVKYNKNINREITSAELAELGIEPDIENISISELEKMLE